MPSHFDQVIDENATAENVAEQQIWYPTLRPARRRWLELAVVIDDSQSLMLWRDSLHELLRLLAQVGAFRDVRVWWLDASRPDRITLHARAGEAPRSPERAPGELLSSDGTRVVLIASDCVSPAWDSAEIGRLVGTWAARQPVALLQLLPPQLWPRTGLDPARGVRNVLAGAREPGMPNARLHWRTWRARMSSDSALDTKVTFQTLQDAHASPRVPIPVITAEPESMGTWAKLVRYGGSLTVPAVIFPSSARVVQRAELSTDIRDTHPRDAIMSFRAVSSALAFRLVGLFSAAPLSLAVMRLIQRTLLPQSRQVHLAEVFLGGLIQAVPVESTGPDSVAYDFLPGVRDLLLNASFAREAIQVQRTISLYMEERFGHAFDFDAILESPDDFDGTTVTAQNAAFARISAEVLKRLGSRYSNAVARLTGEAPSPKHRAPRDNFPANDPQLAQLPPRIQGIVLLRTALRLEACARMPNWLTRTAGQRACRVLVECAETILCVPKVNPSTFSLLQQQIRSLQKPEDEIKTDRFGPIGRCAMQFALAAANRALDPQDSQLRDDLGKCGRAVRKLESADRRWVQRLMREDTIRILSPEPRRPMEPTGLLGRLWPLWPDGPKSVMPLPIGRRPTTFVLVAGATNSRSLQPITLMLGRALAAAGFGLITGGARGVDQEVAEAFLERLGTWQVNSGEWFLQVLRPGQSNAMGGVATIVQTGSDIDSLATGFARARAVVLLGGSGGTERVGKMALATNTLLLPLVETGGAAKLIFGQMIEQWNRLRSGISSLRHPIDAANLASNDPFAAVMMFPDIIRRYANPQKRRGSADRIRVDIESELNNNVVTIRGISDATVTGCVLANPRVIVTRIPRRTEIASKARIVVSYANARAHRAMPILFTLEDSAGTVIVFEVPRQLSARGLECSDSALRKQQRLRVGATSNYAMLVNLPLLNQLPPQLREMYALSRPLVREFALDRRYARLMQGAPLLDEHGQVRGLLQLGEGSQGSQSPGRGSLIPVVDWYRRVLVRCAAIDVMAADRRNSR